MLSQLPKLDRKTTLTMANAIFVGDGWPLLDSYQATVRKYYDAEIANLDFLDGARSLQVINGWCADHTNGLIPKILDEVDPKILAYLLNAIYFKSQWVNKFQPSVTREEPFVDESGRTPSSRSMKKAPRRPPSPAQEWRRTRSPGRALSQSSMPITPSSTSSRKPARAPCCLRGGLGRNDDMKTGLSAFPRQIIVQRFTKLFQSLGHMEFNGFR